MLAVLTFVYYHMHGYHNVIAQEENNWLMQQSSPSKQSNKMFLLRVIFLQSWSLTNIMNIT